MPGETFARKDFSASDYKKYRPEYPPELFQTIFKAHDEGGGGHDAALDLGCGPGVATAPLLPHFKKVFGADPGEGMVAVAKQELPQAEFHVGTADNLSFLGDESVDLISAGTCAHWFTGKWWEELDRVLKPKGTVAIFVYGGARATAHGDQIRDLVDLILEKFHITGNPVARSLYDTLDLPPPTLRIKLLRRQFWNRDGLVDGSEAGGRGRWVMSVQANVKQMRATVYTASPVHKFHTEHPELRGTKDDPIEQVLEMVKEKLGIDEDTMVECGYPLGLVLFRKE